MAKRPKFSRWRRLPGVYRFGDQKVPDPGMELQRISLYLPGKVLDLATEQASRQGFSTAEAYCTEMLLQAIDAEQVREHVADVEAKRGPFEGLHEIADDPEYLAELSAAHEPKRPEPSVGGDPRLPQPGEATTWPSYTPTAPGESAAAGDNLPGLRPAGPVPLSAAAWVVLRHAGQAEDDPHAFLACLRRGEPVSPGEVAELAQALQALEAEFRGATLMDRRLGFALHRLAFESQILHTDAWPQAFDPWTVDLLRAVQEAVERILSGQDIRYYDAPAPAADPTLPPRSPRELA